MEQTAYGVRDTDTAAHFQARNAADVDTVRGDRRPGEGSASARVDAVDTSESGRINEQRKVKGYEIWDALYGE